MSDAQTYEQQIAHWSTTECELHEMIGCSICKPKAPKPDLPDFGGIAWAETEAKYDGTCQDCGNSIYQGDSIKRSDKHGAFVHAAGCN